MGDNGCLLAKFEPAEESHHQFCRCDQSVTCETKDPSSCPHLAHFYDIIGHLRSLMPRGEYQVYFPINVAD